MVLNLSKYFVFLNIVILTITYESQISTYNCNFYVTSNTTKHDTFTFHFCTWQVCDSYTQDTNTTQCQHYSTSSSSQWRNCMEFCCSRPNSHQTYDSLNSCYQNNQKSTKIVILCFIAVFLVILGVMVYLCCGDAIAICCRSFCSCICRCCRKGSNSEQRDGEFDQWIHIRRNDVDELELLDSNCCICFKKNINLSLRCSHAFHHRCLNGSSSAQCPKCFQKSNVMTIYCRQCKKSKKIVSFNDRWNFNIIKQEICNSCS